MVGGKYVPEGVTLSCAAMNTRACRITAATETTGRPQNTEARDMSAHAARAISRDANRRVSGDDS